MAGAESIRMLSMLSGSLVFVSLRWVSAWCTLIHLLGECRDRYLSVLSYKNFIVDLSCLFPCYLFFETSANPAKYVFDVLRGTVIVGPVHLDFFVNWLMALQIPFVLILHYTSLLLFFILLHFIAVIVVFFSSWTPLLRVSFPLIAVYSSELTQGGLMWCSTSLDAAYKQTYARIFMPGLNLWS